MASYDSDEDNLAGTGTQAKGQRAYETAMSGGIGGMGRSNDKPASSDHDVQSDDFGGSGTGQAGGHGVRQDFAAGQQRHAGQQQQQAGVEKGDLGRSGKKDIGMGKSDVGQTGTGAQAQRADLSASKQLDEPKASVMGAGTQPTVGTGDQFTSRGGQTGAGYAADESNLAAGGGLQGGNVAGTTGKAGKVGAGDKIMGGLEKAAGKVTRNPGMQERGMDRTTADPKC